MKHALFAVKDTKTTFWKPFTHFSAVSAMREIASMVNADATNPVKENPADYELWCLGEYDDITGDIVPALEFVCTATSLERVSK